MSYARFGSDDSDVYVFLNVGGFLDCCACKLVSVSSYGTYSTHRTGDMIFHLGEHRSAGHVVPQYTIDSLNREWDANDAFMREARESTPGIVRTHA